MRILKRASLWIWVCFEESCWRANMRLWSPSSGQMPMPRSAPSSGPSAHHRSLTIRPSIFPAPRPSRSNLHDADSNIRDALARHQGLHRTIPLAARTTRCSIYLLLRTHPHDPSCALCSQPSAHAQITPSQICPSADMGKRVGLCKCHCCAC
jgi:hypothetical protein